MLGQVFQHCYYRNIKTGKTYCEKVIIEAKIYPVRQALNQVVLNQELANAKT